MASCGAPATSGSPAFAHMGTSAAAGSPPSEMRETAHTPDSWPTSVRESTPVRALKMCMRLLASPTTTHEESMAIEVGMAGFCTWPWPLFGMLMS